jgi:hypothetical protein
MPPQEMIIGILAVWRITHLLTSEHGPAGLLTRLRQRLGAGFWGDLVSCFYCLSLWTAAPAAWLAAGSWRQKLAAWLAFSGGAILLERATSPPSPAALYSEDVEPAAAGDGKETYDVLR